MEILKGFEFQLQRFAWTSNDGSGTDSTNEKLILKELPVATDGSDIGAADVYFKAGAVITVTDKTTDKTYTKIGTLAFTDSTDLYTLTLASGVSFTSIDAKGATTKIAVVNSKGSAITLTDSNTNGGAVSLANGSTVTVQETSSKLVLSGLTATSGVTVTSTDAVELGLGSTSATTIGYGTDEKSIIVTAKAANDTVTIKNDGSVTAFSDDATFTTTESLSIKNDVSTYSLKGTAKITKASGAADIFDGAELSNVPAVALTTEQNAKGAYYTVNGTKLKITEDNSATITLTPVGPTDGAAIGVGNADTGDTIEVADVSSTTGVAALTFGVASWTGVSKGVVFNCNDTLANTTADLDASGETVTVGGYTVTSTSNNAITVNANGSVSNATSGETFIITETASGSSKVFTWYNDNIVKVNAGGAVSYYNKSGANTYDFGLTGLGAASSTPIKTTSVTTGTQTYNSLGLKEDGAAAAVVDATTSTRKITVNEQIGNAGAVGVNASTDTIQVVDKGTNTLYTLADDSTVKANGVTFTATSGVVSDASNTITIVNNSDNFKAKGTVSVDAAALNGGTGTVTYVAGGKVEAAKIALSATKVITLTEDNSVEGATNTVITAAGAISGLEGDATIKTEGLAAATKFNTVSDGTFVFNGTSFTVAGDGNGVTFTTGATTATYNTVASVSSLATGATVTTGALSAIDLDVYGSTTVSFTGITAKNGVKFTAESQTKTSIQLLTKGDTFTIGSNVYTVEAMGSGSNYITVSSDGTITGLDDGDVLKVANTGSPTADYIEYSVSGGVLASKQYTTAAGGLASNNSYTLNDGESNGFTVAAGNVKPMNGTSGADTTGSIAVGGAAVNSLSDGVYINADGTTTTSSNKAVAQVKVSDDTITYQATGNKAQNVAISGDTATKQNWVVNTGAGKDEIAVSAGTADVTINSGTGKDEINLAGTSTGDKTVTVGDGSSKVTLGGSGDINLTLGSGNDTVTTSGTPAGDIVITANSGNNSINLTNATGDVTINGGSGNDTITAASEDNVVSGGGGNDVFNIGTGITISDYSFGNDVIQVGAGVTLAPAMLTGDGKISVAAGVEADISAGAGDFYAADIKIGTNKALHTAWAKEGGSNINTTSFSKDALVKDDADGVNTLYTGAGDDFIYSYADNDSVYGGEGKDTITLQAKGEGRVVGIATNSSKDTVSGFTAGFSDSDSIFMVDGDVSGVKTTLESVSGGTGKFTFKDGAASLTMGSVGVNTVTGAAEILVNGFKLAALAAGATAKVDEANYADIYMGDQSAVDFSAVDGELFVDLSNGLAGSSAGAKYVGVNAVTGGTGNSTLMGTGSADYIVATGGKTSLFGGAGSDTLVGNSNSADVFFFGDGTGRNTITNFTTQGNDNADTLQVYSNITGAKLNGSNVEISTADGSKAILTNQNANSKINVASTGFTGVAKVGSASSANNFNYDNDVTYYGGGSASDKIAFASGYTDNAEIWMNGSQGKSYASIDVVDGTNTSGSLIVAGDSASQSIIGGKGDTSLWGGAGSATDTLKSSSTGKTMFWWGAGDGNDVVVSASTDDSVNLYNVKLSDINSANSSITNSGVVLALNDGSKLTMQTNRGMTFSIEGQSWTADQSSKEWKQNS